MSIVTVPPFLWPNQSYNDTGGYSKLIDASGEKVAFCVQVPRTGTINRIGFRTATVTTGQTLRVGLQTLDGSGNPSGSAYGSMVAGTQAIADTDDNNIFIVTLGTPATAVQGDDIAIVIEFDSTIGNLEIAVNGNQPLPNFPYVDHFTSAWGHDRQTPICLLGYSDGSGDFEDCGSFWFNAADTPASFNSASSPDEYGNAFTLPAAIRVAGMWWIGAVADGADYNAILYDGTSALKTRAVDGDFRYANGYYILHRKTFASSQVLTANHEYIIAVQAASATLNIQPAGFSVGAQGQLNGIGLGKNFYRVNRVNAGAWTTEVTKQMFAGLIVNGIDSGSGGGGLLVHPGMTGGFNG